MSVRQRFVPFVVVIALLGSPATASARFMDWIAWFEELSGPGPFRGIEFSFEVACAQLGHKRRITAVTKSSPQYRDAMEARGLKDLLPTLPQGARKAQSLPAAKGLPPPTLAPQLEALWAAVEREDDSLASERSARIVMEMDNCALNRKEFARQLNNGRRTASQSLSLLDDTDIPYDGPSVGVVLGIGRYISIDNKLLDQDAKRSDQRVTAVFYDVLLHSKVSPAFDVGAGVGLSHFSGHGVTGDHFSFVRPHVVPLSLVVKPLALMTDNRLGQGLGTRVAARLLPYRLDGADFGAPDVPFSQAGELLWGASVYVDIGTLLWGTGGR